MTNDTDKIKEICGRDEEATYLIVRLPKGTEEAAIDSIYQAVDKCGIEGAFVIVTKDVTVY